MRLVDSVQKHPIRDQKSALAVITPVPPFEYRNEATPAAGIVVAAQLTRKLSKPATVLATVAAAVNVVQAPSVACVVEVGEANPLANVRVGALNIVTGVLMMQLVCVVSTAEQGASGKIAALSLMR